MGIGSYLRTAGAALVATFALVVLAGPANADSHWDESPTIQEIKDRGVLRAGTSLAAPSSFKHPQSGELDGVVIRIGREAAERLGVELELIETGWDTIIAGLQAGQYDVALAGLFETPQRQEVVDFVTFGQEGIAFLVRENNDEINAVDDLKQPGVSIATVTGSGSEQMIQANFQEAEIRSILSPAGGSGAPPEEVISGRADAAQFDAVLTEAYRQRFPELKVVPENAFEEPLFPTPTGMAVPKDDPLFQEFLASVVADLREEGKLSEWRHQWSQPELLLSD